MSDSNPYEPPQADEPAPLKKIVKRGLGAATLAMLTPLAVIITGAISCVVAAQYPAESANSSGGYPIVAVLLIWLIPPALVFAVMFYFIIRARRKQRRA